MSRLLTSALALCIFCGTGAQAQPLNINPYPKAVTPPLEELDIPDEAPAEAFTQEAEEEILRLEQENEALAEELEVREAEKRMKQAQQAAAEAERQKEAKLLEERRAAELQRKAELERKKVELAERLAAEEQAYQMKKQREAAELEAAEEERQMKIDQEVADLEQQNAELTKQLEKMQMRKAEEANSAIVELDKREPVEDAPEVIDLRAENKRLSTELREVTAANRKQAELDLALRAMEAQKKADMAALEPLDDAKPEIDPLFEAEAMKTAAHNNPVQMTPMPIQSQPLAPDEVMEVRASDLGLAPPETAHVLEAAPEPVKTSMVDPAKTTIQILPMPTHKTSLTRLPMLKTAQPGESLEDVLRNWSQAEGIGFLWRTTQRYDVAAPVSNDGNYASSVEALLGQYNGQPTRPVGKLHTDPVTGFTTLSVFSE